MASENYVCVVCILTVISMASESYVFVVCILTVISMAYTNDKNIALRGHRDDSQYTNDKT
jgi:hypothetical protein